MAEKVNTRELVLDILLAVSREEQFSHIAIRNVLDKYRYLPRQERAFITRLSEGTIERSIELDYIIDQYSRTPVRKMKPVIRCLLRMGVYQLKYMDTVPDSAACNETVKLAVKRGFSGLRGFVNGVMRTIARQKAAVKLPDPQQQPAEYLSVVYSMPLWIVERFLRQFGREHCSQILEAYLEERPLSIRVDTDRISSQEMIGRLHEQGITAEQAYGLPFALQISGYDTLDAIPEFREGLFYIQDGASMMAVALAGLHEEMQVIDVCAAPGGKSLQAAQSMHGTGHVLSRDLTEAKVELIEENIARTGVENMSAQVWDATVADPSLTEKMDLVIADLPCSGLGVIGRKSDIKYRTSQEQIGQLAALQQQILSVVKDYVKPGGILLYSTCTITPEENQDNTRIFLEKNQDFTLVLERQLLPDQGCDGFYIAKMEKKA